MINALLTNAIVHVMTRRHADQATPATTDGDARSDLIEDQRGALTFIEWVIIFALVVVVIAIAASALAGTVSGKMNEVDGTIQGLDVTI